MKKENFKITNGMFIEQREHRHTEHQLFAVALEEQDGGMIQCLVQVVETGDIFEPVFAELLHAHRVWAGGGNEDGNNMEEITGDFFDELGEFIEDQVDFIDNIPVL